MAGYRSSFSFEEIVEGILNGPGDCKIFGSTVYKWKARGEKVDDIDCLCDNMEEASKNLQEQFGAKIDYFSELREIDFENYDRLTIGNIGIDLISSKEYYERHLKKNNFINSVHLTKDGLRHSRAGLSNDNAETVDFIMRNLAEGRYCPFSNPREKDTKYFEKFQIIPEEECRKYGLGIEKGGFWSWFFKN